jgi:hypothetical protein
VAPLYESIWPKFYGGTTRIVSCLTVHKLVRCILLLLISRRECEMTALDDCETPYHDARRVEV